MIDNDNPFNKLKLRNFILWYIISQIIISILSKLNIKNNFLSFIFLHLIIVTWVIFKSSVFNIDIKKLIGKLPSKYNWWEIFYIATPLVLFSIGVTATLLYTFSLIAPVFTENILNSPSNITQIGFVNQILFICIIFPIIEEFFFRGIILNRLYIKWGLRQSIIISSFIFSMFHMDLIGGFIFGIVMALLYIKNQTLIIPIICHIINNIAFTVLYFFEKTLNTDKMSIKLNELYSDSWLFIVFFVFSSPWIIYLIWKNWFYITTDYKPPYTT
ncbi:type II CAAX prenyl endopeptidase Rce1 family protein [Petroclostridium xylanilyticum]|jgi:hypothetical protein|uniref:CPBP family glutamic-type intramembrane protease n=1 Tax=Petroclostridium xylanilyticum TaxID=1792311 RepID=UPI000B99BEB5|nr:CPBP family glutamic-type intramembrane protease [Petroclostridium xylanilyticum]